MTWAPTLPRPTVLARAWMERTVATGGLGSRNGHAWLLCAKPSGAIAGLRDHRAL